MEPVILEQPALQLDEAQVVEKLHVRAGSRNAAEARRLAGEAVIVARPKMLYKVAFVESQTETETVIDGFTFASRILRVNLENIHRVFAFVSTAGSEIERWVQRQEDPVQQYWADALSEMVLGAATTEFLRRLESFYGVETLSAMHPGSLADWPLTQQRVLFSLLGDVEAAIGVELTSSLLMLPKKSISGILFPAAESFASCQLCPREICPNRRAPYDAELFNQKYRAASTR